MGVPGPVCVSRSFVSFVIMDRPRPQCSKPDIPWPAPPVKAERAMARLCRAERPSVGGLRAAIAEAPPGAGSRGGGSDPAEEANLVPCLDRLAAKVIGEGWVNDALNPAGLDALLQVLLVLDDGVEPRGDRRHVGG